MMNPSSAGLWNNPPPPGIDFEEEGAVFFGSPAIDEPPKQDEPKPEKPPEKEVSERSVRKRSKSKSHERRKSRDRSSKKRYRSRSRSRTRHRRSRSRSRRRYRSTSRSRSRSSSYDRYRRRRRYRRSRSRRYSRSSSRSRSRSRARRHHRSKRHSRDREDRTSESPHPVVLESEDIPDVAMEDDEPEPPKENAFKNDGSFLEMFKKMQEEQAAAQAQKQEAPNEIKKPLPAFGKRRGGRVLKTGLVEKTKTTQTSDGNEPQDAWSIYLKEVKRYKEACCDDDSKTRPLVK